MDISGIHVFLAQAAPGATAPDPRANMVFQIGLFALVGVMLYFVMIRPQQKKAKEQAEMLKGVKSGDKVMTSAGIIGVVVTVKDKTVTLRSADTKLELAKSAITEITERGSQATES